MCRQHILLETYLGSSFFFYDVISTGVVITRAKAMELGLVSEKEFDLHKNSNYGPEWHEISPGDKITIDITDGDHDDKYVFIIPEGGLPDPPVKLGDPRSGSNLHKYLMEHCQYAHT